MESAWFFGVVAGNDLCDCRTGPGQTPSSSIMHPYTLYYVFFGRILHSSCKKVTKEL